MIKTSTSFSHATWREIYAQPDIWRAWAEQINIQTVKDWIKGQSFDEIWFCGAGTSAFIGDILVAGLEGHSRASLRAIATTDIVSQPQSYLDGKQRPLVVNFGRSGNSAETIGILDALDALAPDAPRLNITCNSEGALASRPSLASTNLILLPDSTHDQGFAMTASFSTMLLTAIGLFDPRSDFKALPFEMADILNANLPSFSRLAEPQPDRVVYIGSGALKYAAGEAALKTLELSAGYIPAIWDSCLGFRHGPKSFVLPGTMVVIFLSAQLPTRSYDMDLILELRDQYPENVVVSVGEGGDMHLPAFDWDLWSVPLCVALAQVVSVIWSDQLGLNVDNPFAGQDTLSRVVADVPLYAVGK